MKKFITTSLISGLFIAVILIIGSNTSWAYQTTCTQNMSINLDPNEPNPEINLMDITNVDSNEPNPEIVPMSFLSDADPNEPNPE